MEKKPETPGPFSFLGRPMDRNISAMLCLAEASQNYMAGLARYTGDFMASFMIAAGYFRKEESRRLSAAEPMDMVSQLQLLDFNLDLLNRGLFASLQAVNTYGQSELRGFIAALYSTFANADTGDMAAFVRRQADLMDLVANAYPRTIQDIEPEYGFHFERGEHHLAAETDRFFLYRIAPTDPRVQTRADGKPILIIPPYVLGANILGFLPGEQKSYAHGFANRGVPTYIRILKDIQTTEALQVMTGEDDARDTRGFCEAILQAHGRPVTLNGYCQGGFSALCDLLSGQMDGLVDAFITCVAPMDGTRSKGLAAFLKSLPERFKDLAYGTKTLPNGRQVADGKLMGWVYKLKSIEHESPIPALYRDLSMFARQGANPVKIGKTAAALNYWLNNERYDLPLAITRMSFDSYNVPITRDGILPVRLFGGRLDLNRIKAMEIPWLICYGEHDDLVEKDTALAPLDWVPAEVTPFPKGHVAMATSWSHPESACALHTRFGTGNWRGPVRFHLDLEQAADKPPVALKATAKKTRPRKTQAAGPQSA